MICRTNYIIRFFAILLGSPLISFGQKYDPQANPKAIIQPEKEVRFTVLTPGMIRMEWDSLGHFTDQASFIVVNRRSPVPSFTKRNENGWCIIRTDSMELKYRIGSGKFNENNLQVIYNKAGNDISWHPGLQQKQNLKGTYRTLDEYDGDTKGGKKMPLEDGILARDGWTLIDDSKSLLFDNASFPWIDTTARHSAQDWYLLLYGTHYKKALADYALIGGKVPLPPRFAFGYWWSRYWRYSDNEFRNLVAGFKKYNVPLDVLVIDMDWHKQGWTGWTWDSSLFADPAKFLAWTNKEHLKTTLNLHPADGVASHETQYLFFAKAMNVDAAKGGTIPYLGSDKKFMQTLFDSILYPYEKQGVDFWWLDWQQWLNDKKVKGLSNTWWLNYVFFTEKEKYGNTRPMLYHRWGGLGNHRYQIGFSGDAYITWKSLEFQPYFTSTASNVLYDYWSHDIGGHIPPENFKGLDPELYTRWVQYGVFSPILRTHSTKNGLLNKEIWNFSGIYFDAIYNAIKLRYALQPYIYTMARKTYDSALALCRPLYYDYPNTENAYKFDRQYQFGDDMMVAPIGTPSDSGLSLKQVWLPEGNDWYEWSTGTLLKGGQTLNRQFYIDEYPLYVKAGAIIPMNSDSIQNLDGQPEAIHLGVFPGAACKGKLYEDNGNDKYYDRQFSTTNYEAATVNNNLTLTIYRTKGSFIGMHRKRNYKISFYGRMMPASVMVSGRSIPYSSDSKEAHWYYNGDQMSIEVTLPIVNALKGEKIKVNFINVGETEINGLPQKIKRLYLASEELKYKKAGIVLPNKMAQMEELNRTLEYYPDKAAQLINEFNNNYSLLPAMLNEIKGLSNEDKASFLKKISF